MGLHKTVMSVSYGCNDVYSIKYQNQKQKNYSLFSAIHHTHVDGDDCFCMNIIMNITQRGERHYDVETRRRCHRCSGISETLCLRNKITGTYLDAKRTPPLPICCFLKIFIIVTGVLDMVLPFIDVDK